MASSEPAGERDGASGGAADSQDLFWLDGRPIAPMPLAPSTQWPSGGASVPLAGDGGEDELDELEVAPWWEGVHSAETDDDWIKDFDRPFGRRRRPRSLRVIGVVTAGFLLLASVGTGVGMVIEQGQASSFSVRVQSVTPRSTAGTGASGYEHVSFLVTNDSANSASPECTVEVVQNGQGLGAGPIVLGSIASGDTVQKAVTVPIERPASSATPASGRVICY